MRLEFLSLLFLLIFASGCSGATALPTARDLPELSPTITPSPALTEILADTSTPESAYPYPVSQDTSGRDAATAYPAGFQTSTPLPIYTPVPTITPTPITPTPTRGPLETPLPAPVYMFLPSIEKEPYRSIWRLEQDGYTLNQITHEEKRVDFFNVAPDGRLAYLSNNNLIIADKDGNHRRILIAGKEPLPQGSSVEQNLLYSDYEEISFPAWSPNGKLIAYHRNGIYLIDVSTEKSTQILEGPQAITNEAGVLVPADRVAPRNIPIGWTPDGSRIIVRVVRYEEGSMAFILPVAGAEKVDVDVPQGGCCDYSFTRDGSMLFGSGWKGLWRIDPVTGKGTNLVAAKDEPVGQWPIVQSPAQAPDGRIFFFITWGAWDEEIGWKRLAYMKGWKFPFRIPEDIIVVNDELSAEKALWIPDTSRVIAYDRSGQLVIIETVSGKVIPLGLTGYDLHWGVR
jgi:hypothetical protein